MCSPDNPIVDIEITEDELGSYYGWKDEDDQYSMIYESYVLLNICFPCGIKEAEKAGKGKAVRLSIVEIKDSYD